MGVVGEGGISGGCGILLIVLKLCLPKWEVVFLFAPYNQYLPPLYLNPK